MAKVNRRGLTHLSGSVGEYTYRQVNGETIMSMKRQGEVGLPTNKQMLRRVRWANLVNMAKLLHQYKVDDIAFPNLSGMSWLNKFIKMNANRTVVALTKEDAGKGMAIADNYKLSEGTIDPWDGTTGYAGAPQGTTDDDDKPVMYLPMNAISGDAPTKVGPLSNMILNNYPNLQDKDVLTFVIIYSPHTKDVITNKWFGSQIGVRQFQIDKSKTNENLPSWISFTTDSSNTTMYVAFLGPKSWGSVKCDEMEPAFCLVGRGANIINTTEYNAATSGDGLPQTAYFSSDDYIEDAIKSYGGSKPVPFLQPGENASASNEANESELAIDSNHEKSPMEAKKTNRKK